MSTGSIPLNNAVANQLITSALWNAELGNIQTLTAPEGIEGYEDTDAETQIQTAPYPGSVLSKATSLAGDLERLRYQLAQILGTDYWYKPAATNLTSVGNVVVPIGGTIDYPVVTAPSASWHLADGTAISRAGFPTLFTLIGTTFGIGDGATTFNLPDYRDRMSIGAGTSYAVGATGGEATHVLTKAESPSGLLTFNDPGHIHTDAGHTHNVTDPNHTHTADLWPDNGVGTSRPLQVATTTPKNNGGAAVPTSVAITSDPTNISIVTGNASINSHTTGASLTDNGTNAAHNNLPPYLAMYKMIRVL